MIVTILGLGFDVIYCLDPLLIVVAMVVVMRCWSACLGDGKVTILSRSNSDDSTSH